jgi:LmeA-like phospholipid-binding
VSQYPTAPLPTQSHAPRRSPRRWWLAITIIVLVVLGLLVIGDRVAKAYAENRIAQQIEDQGFKGKPDVSIAGFPFLTQVARRDLRSVNISASTVNEGLVEIHDLNADLSNVHINNSFTGGTVEHLTGTALITFGNLLSSAGGPSVTVTAIKGDEVKFKVDLGFVSGTATARVTQQGRNKIHVHVVSADGLPLDVLGPLADFTITVPPMPLGMSVQSISVSGQGVIIHVIGHNVAFSQ